MFNPVKLNLATISAGAVIVIAWLSTDPAWASVARSDPLDSVGIRSAVVGAIVGYIASRAFRNDSTADPLRFTLVGLVGGLGGAFLAVLMVDSPSFNPGPVFTLSVIGAIVGAAVLSYVLRILHPREPDN